MSRDRARRTSSGSTLRLVGQDAGPDAAGVRVPDAAAVDVGEDGATAIVLPGQRQSVGMGRHWVVRTAAAGGVVGMANQVVELLSSELLANAVLHGLEGGAVGVQVRITPALVRVSVSDGGGLSPVVLHREPSAPDGRGMAIVEAMSSRWGVDAHAEGGKTVWFELDLDDF
ncbi:MULTISPECIES: ATP-binding protein [unclassified Actinotalea]|uniref:ATP-binding protein n=1 Tax=unclassified Actinotalea TaxID=2638618 RepID=UPI002101F67D|nr:MULTISPECIES: ATP-binding protein [unclassified Actinotalea]